MGVLFDYFAADSPEAAAAAIDGPPEGALSARGIDPVVALGELEHLLTGAAPARGNPPVAMADGGERLVLPIAPALRTALAVATPADLAAAARSWSQSDQFDGQADPAALTGFLTALAALSRQGNALYCWVCV